MRIKTRLRITVALSIVSAVMIGAILFMALQKMHDKSKEAVLAAQIVKDMAQLKMVAQEFLMLPGERPMRQWKLKYDSLTTLFNNTGNAFASPDEKIAMQKIVRDLARFKTVFNRLTSGFNREGGIGEADKAISSALRDRLTAELLVRSQATLSPAFQLQQFIQTELVADQQRANRLIVIFLVVLVVFIIAISFWINMSIGTPLATLEKGAQIIGSGDLDHKVDITATDEIGQLSRAFDQMADDLKKTTASIVDLNREIAERRQAEAALTSEKERLMVTLHSIGDGVIVSDTKANVTLMNKVAEELTGWNQKDAAHPDFEHLKGVEASIESAANLTRQLLGFARGGQYEVKPTNLNDLVSKSVDMFGRTKKEITIHKKSQKEIWTVEADQGQIEQVLLNLYINAWQACPPSRALRRGGRAMSGAGELFLDTENVTLDENYVKPHRVKPGRYVKISVTDTGIGMDKATQKRIFNPFFTTKEIGRGTGMGLASAYGIIKNHDGIINVYSEEGKGATFNIYLPATDAEGAVPGGESEKPGEHLRGTETVLLVDDEEMIIEVGRELIDPDIKVLLSSGYSINGPAKKILARGCNGFIQKPFSLKDLSHKLREILDTN